jgi:hypothetical protein
MGSRLPRTTPGPWHELCPRKPSVPCRVHRWAEQLLWLPSGSNPSMAHGIGASVTPTHDSGMPRRAGTGANQSWWLSTNPYASSLSQPYDCSHVSRKGLCHLKRHPITHAVITGPREFVRHCLDRHDPVGPALFPLIEALDGGGVPHGKVRSFHKGPR